MPCAPSAHLSILRRCWVASWLIVSLVLEAIAKATTEATDGKSQTELGFRAYFRWVADDHDAFRLLFGPGTASDDEFALDIDDWPSDDGQQTLVIDRSGGDVDLVPLAKLGYKVLTAEDCQIGQLLECFRRWTGETPSSEIVRDAIEEYLAV